MPIQIFKRFVKERLGLHFGPDADERLRTVLAGRMTATAVGSVDIYLEALASDAAELRRLTSLLTVNETYFYREPSHLSLLVERLAPALLARAEKGVPIRILSLGCSTGEEPYSIAIALRERFGDLAAHLFRISAADVDEAALEHARTAVYGRFAFRALPAELRDRWFSAVDETHRRVDDAIRRQVHLLALNLLAPDYPRSIQDQDVIFFRNVSIYFDAATRKALMTRLRDLLKPQGHLIVGASETLANDFGLMRLHALDGIFLFDKGPVARSPERPGAVSALRPTADADGERTCAPRPLRSGAAQPPGAQRQAPAAPRTLRDALAPAARPTIDADRARYARALALARSERFEDALGHLNPLCDREDAAAEHLALQAHLLLEQGDTAGAEAAARCALAREPWSSDALLLLGRCARLRGDREESIRALRRLIYDKPTCWRAHYQLAEAYREQGDLDPARREYRIVLRQLEDRTLAMQCTGELPSLLSVKDLRFLCETRLARLAHTAA
jgi:chemotaxis protein methyltransferase CheR